MAPHPIDDLPDPERMFAALDKIARMPDFPPSNAERAWNEMVTIARVCLLGVDLMAENEGPRAWSWKS